MKKKEKEAKRSKKKKWNVRECSRRVSNRVLLAGFSDFGGWEGGKCQRPTVQNLKRQRSRTI